eukprot:COSAG01_NODE_42420_length_440_cov_0.894428_1_plen_42_part_01
MRLRVRVCGRPCRRRAVAAAAAATSVRKVLCSSDTASRQSRC